MTDTIALKFLAIIVVAIVGGVLLASDALYVLSFGPAYTYNPIPSCSVASKTTIEAIIANKTFTSIGNKRWIYPPCSSYVEIDSVVVTGIQSGQFPNNFDPRSNGNQDCALFWDGVYCDTTFDVTTFGYNSTTGLTLGQHTIHVEIDKNWKASGIAPPEMTCQNQCVVNLVGFVYFDPGHILAPNHYGNGWEIHPLATWKCVAGC